MTHSDNCVWCGNSLNTDNGPVQLVGGSHMHAECELDYYGMETFQQELQEEFPTVQVKEFRKQDIAEVAALLRKSRRD